MITDSYSKMMLDISMRSTLKDKEDLSKLMRERRQQDVGTASTDLDKDLNIYRSGSAPPTVEGSLNSIGGLFNEEQLRADPAYLNYYYNNAHLNPRLLSPSFSKEDWRVAQRLREPLPSLNVGSGLDWGRDPLTGVGSRQKTIQGDWNTIAPVSRQLSRPARQSAFKDGDLTSIDGFHSGADKQGMNMCPSASLSRNATPDPQLAARAPSPRIPTAGGGRTTEKLNPINMNSFISVSGSLSESADLVAALSGLNLPMNMANEENDSKTETQNDIGDHHGLFNLQGNSNHMKQNPYLDNPESGHFSLCSAQELAKGKSRGLSMDRNRSSFKGSSTPTLNGVGSPSQFNSDKLNSPFQNYGLTGFSMNPSSPPMMGNQLGSGNLPSLFENVAAASAMTGTGLDSRVSGGGLALGPNLMAAAAELQNLNGFGNQMPLADPLYLQYSRSNEFTAAQLAALSDPTMGRDYANNSYMDLLQKAYLGALLSPQKPQYGAQYGGKSGNLNNNYLGNPAFGLGMSYPGSPWAGSVLQNSPLSSGSPVRHIERNLHFSSGMGNNSGGIMGAWHSEPGGGNFDESFASTLLDEYKSNKTKCFELSEIAGHVVEFSSDQYGSRFIQQKLETATTEDKNMVFHEIMPQALSLMTDVFGNYVVQKFFEHGTACQIRELADQLTGHVLNLSLQMYGCRVIQKAIEVVDLDQQTMMVKELDGHVMRCVRDQNGNHVIQKCIECIPEDAIQFVVSTFYDQVLILSTHPYGCRVIQRVLEYCHDPKTQQIMMDKIMQSVCMLAQDQYGNYVVQHVLEHGKPHERTAIIKKLTGQIVQMSQQKFASNVIEKCLTFGTAQERQTLVNEMLGTTDENEPLQLMMKDQFANYVVQKVLETCDDQQLELILNRIKTHLNALKKYTYGKHIVARVEKLVAAGERRISILTLNPAA